MGRLRTYVFGSFQLYHLNHDGDIWYDVVAFRARLSEFEAQRQGQAPCAWPVQPLTDALELYRGDLLVGFYDDWCLAERECLQQLLLRTLARLVAHHRATGQYDVAIAHGQHILSLDPLREEVHREVMRCHYLAGRRADALRQFAACRAVLAQELGVEPMPEMVSLCRQIRDGCLREEAPWLAQAAQPTDGAVPTMAQLRTILQELEDARRRVLEAMQAISALNLDQDGVTGARESLS